MVKERATLSLHTITSKQLGPLLERVLNKSEVDAPLVLVRGNPEHAPTSVSVPGRDVELLASSSPLEIRARVVRTRTRPLAVVTDCDTALLGEDLVARAVSRKVYSVDRWEIVNQLFAAEGVTRTLSKHSEIADALIERSPDKGYIPATTKILDLDFALDALSFAVFEVRAETLEELLIWAETPDAARAVHNIDASVLGLLEGHLTSRLGPGAEFAFVTLRAGLAVDLNAIALTAVALTAGVIHDDADSDLKAAVRLEVRLGDPGLSGDAYRALAAVAVERVKRPATDRASIARWLIDADKLLVSFGAEEQAWRSDVLPSGFTQRLVRAAEAIERWRLQPENCQNVTFVAEALTSAQDHLSTRDTPQRVERLAMAARMVRKMKQARELPTTLAGAIDGYTGDGAWFDRARLLVSQGDPEPIVRSLCESLTTQADKFIDRDAEAIAVQLAVAAHHPQGEVIGVESVLGQVAAPIAKHRPVLVLVLDGMAWPSFLEVVDAISGQGWQPQQHADIPSAVAAVATLPTVTEFSRTSLLCGVLRSGDQGNETRAFAALPELLEVSTKGRPPRLFHKKDLRSDGQDAIPNELLETLRDQRNKVVGLVINNIDERLKDVAAPPSGWGLDELAPLREVLDEARIAGRAVVITADHGHVLERGSEHRVGGGGERWRALDTGPVGGGEIKVNGPRVLTPEGAAVLPWKEKLRYGPLRNGYHGGITAAELIVPVVVFSTETSDDWEPLVIAPPDWWYPALPADGQRPTPASPPAKAKKASPNDLTLFEPDTASVNEVATVTESIARIMASDHVSGQLAKLRLDAVQVSEILRLLDGAGTAMGEQRVADHVGIPRMRMGRLVGQLQRLLNIDGYTVIESGNSEIRFHRELLEVQLGLE